jgi:tRNA pseudouridine38-40 synthase
VRLKLTIAYDGRLFGGWQIQPNAVTVQAEVERALTEVAKEPIRLHGSGRTDAGVHAHAQSAHFDPPGQLTMNPLNWVAALNTKLPATIRVMACEEVPADFHARFSAIAKTYVYDLCTAPVLSPFRAGLVWHLPRQLDPSTLEEALALFQGAHDFAAFAAKRGNETTETSHTRTLTSSALSTLDDGYRLTFTGEGFLYKMVRLLTGSSVLTAQGTFPLDDLAALLEQGPGLPLGKAPLCAPPDGLYLREVCYQ